MQEWKLIALDMDGTLLNEDLTVSEENKYWIRQARDAGIEVTLSSGRYITYVTPFIEELGLAVPVVTNNGCEVWRADGRLIERNTLDLEHSVFLNNLAIEFGIEYRGYSAEGRFYESDMPKDLAPYTWLMYLYFVRDPIVLVQIWERLERHGGFELTMSSPYKIDVNPKGIHKGRGLATVCKHLGIHPGEVVALGDSINDVPMLKWAGMGIAMDNAIDEVKQSAWWVTEDHRRHGVARAIERLLNGTFPARRTGS